MGLENISVDRFCKILNLLTEVSLISALYMPAVCNDSFTLTLELDEKYTQLLQSLIYGKHLIFYLSLFSSLLKLSDRCNTSKG